MFADDARFRASTDIRLREYARGEISLLRKWSPRLKIYAHLARFPYKFSPKKARQMNNALLFFKISSAWELHGYVVLVLEIKDPPFT